MYLKIIHKFISNPKSFGQVWEFTSIEMALGMIRRGYAIEVKNPILVHYRC